MTLAALDGTDGKRRHGDGAGEEHTRCLVALSVQRATPGAMAEEERAWPGRIRHIARGCLWLWGLADVSDDVELLLTELVTNALEHGHGDLAIRITLAGARLRLDVTGESSGAPVLRQAGPDDEGGRGLVLVSAVAEEWGVCDGGMCVWCTVAIPPPGK